MMKQAFFTLLSCSFLVCLYADHSPPALRYCLKSRNEMEKCKDIKRAIENLKEIPRIACVQRSNTKECIDAVKGNQADMVTLDGGDIYTAGLEPNPLKPVAAEDYGNVTFSDTCYYAVAVVKKDADFNLLTVKGKKTCHTGVGKSAGYVVPIGTFIQKGIITWKGPDEEPLDNAIAAVFPAACLPGSLNSSLCSLCKGTGENKCVLSHNEPYYGYDGAYRCLKEGGGQVAFVKHTTVPQAEQEDYMLLCEDGSKRPVKEYKNCYLARIPAHAIVTRSDSDLMNRIWDLVNKLQNNFGKTSKGPFKIFESSHGKDLIYKDSTFRFVRTPDQIDASLYLGPRFVNAVRALKQGSKPTATEKKIKWCTISRKESDKCDIWSTVDKTLSCQKGNDVEDCIAQIMRGESDAITLDGGYIYTAGACGLVPVMAEYYDKDNEMQCQSSQPVEDAPSYYAVAIVKKTSKLKFNELRGKKSCHTAIGRQAGWIIPSGLIYQMTNNCDLGKYFSESCAPGANISSSLCALCKGQGMGQRSKCKSSQDEQYYGYSGAFRCLVEVGDVAFAKHTTTFENTNGNNQADWAKDLKSENFRLLCTDGTTDLVENYKSCHTAKVPAHAVVTRPEKRREIVEFLKRQQELHGNSGTAKNKFNMFSSSPNKDLLFKDSTLCLVELSAAITYTEFLGTEYMKSLEGLYKCQSWSTLQKICRFHSCP